MLNLKLNKFFFHIILEKPSYFYNISSIFRLSVGLHFALHIVGLFSFFSLKTQHLKPSLDYFENCNVFFYDNLLECLNLINIKNIFILEPGKEISTTVLSIPKNSGFIFGSEKKSVNFKVLNIYKIFISIPFYNNIRSYNLSHSISILSSFLLKNLFITFLCLFV